MKIFFDLDEVFVDFVRGACEIHGVDHIQLQQKRVEKQLWDIVPTISEMKMDETFNSEKFWAPIHNQGGSFWASLKPTFWSLHLLEVINSHNLDWYLLTSPCLGVDVHIGKINWIHSFFGHTFDRFFITRHKEVFAGQGRILIDDKPENIDSFVKAGGVGYLFGSSPLASVLSRSNPVKACDDFLLQMIASS